MKPLTKRVGDVKGFVPATWPNHPAIPRIAGRDGLASDCHHSHLVRGFRALSRLHQTVGKKPGSRHQLAVLLSDVTTERAFQRRKAAFFPVYLYWAFSGVTLAAEADGRKRSVPADPLALSPGTR